MAAFYANPQYGLVPGAPQGLNWWDANRFMMSGLQPPPVALPPPPPPLAATVTPQDVAASTAFTPPRTDTGGAQPGSGGPGTGPGGIGGASGGGQDRTTSGYQGVYAQSPVDINSQFGTAGGLLGMGAGVLGGIPGIGTAASALGGALDAARYNGTLGQYGLPGTVNPWGSAAAAALAGIGIPFTDLNLAHAFNVPTARERMDAIINGLAPGLYNDQGFSAIAANQPNNPSAPFGQTGWGPGMNPTTSQYPAGFFTNEDRLTIAANPEIFGAPAQSYAGMTPDARQSLDKAVSDAIAANPDIFGGGQTAGNAPGGQQGVDPTGPGGFGSPGPGMDQGGFGPGAGAGPDTGGAFGPGFWRGGLVGAPPGRYAGGGAVGRVAGRMPTRLEPPPIDMVPRDYMSDAPRGGQYMNDTPMEPPPPSARELMIQGAMEDYLRGQSRTGYPEQFAAGGMVPSAAPGDNITPAQFGALRAINPPGPDDQIGALQTGEGVIRKDAMRLYPGLLAAVNSGALDPKKVAGLLAPAKRGRGLR